MTAAAAQIGFHTDEVSAAHTGTFERLEANHGGWVNGRGTGLGAENSLNTR
jgi:hypothetical protein